MDFMKIALTCLTGIAMLHATEAGCVEDILKDDGFKTCMQEYSTYTTNAVQSAGDHGSPDAANKTVTIMCSPEGQTAIACILPFLERCDNLKKEESLADFAGFAGLAIQGGAAEVCKSFRACMAVGQCFGQAGSTDPSTGDPDTPFGMYQLKIKTLCGPLKHQIDCIKGKEKECPQIMQQLESLLKNSRTQATPGTAYGDYKALAMFVANECPKFPKDFATNKCVKDNLRAQEFKECFVNSTQPHASDDAGDIGCEAYKAGYTCVPKAIDSCDKKYITAFVITTNMFLKVTHPDCKLAIDDTSGSNIVQMSSAVIFSSFLLAYILI